MTQGGFLAELPWLQGLGPEDRQRLERSALRRSFPAGATVFAPTETPASVYVLESGRIQIFRLSRSGEEATLGFVASGEVFGELPSFGAFPRESFARAQQASVIWKVRIDLFRELVRVHSDIGVEVTRQIVRRLKGVESRVEGLILRDVRSRLASALLEFAEHFGEGEGDVRQMELRLSQTEIGTLIGAGRQSVNGAMGELREAGLLRQQGTTFTLLDLPGLRGIAAGSAPSNT